MRTCRHCKGQYVSKRTDKVCALCGKPRGAAFTCKACGKVFYTSPSNKPDYCSRACVPNNASTHGESRTRLHVTWCGMKRRCNPATKHPLFREYYSGRGVSVCPAWADSYEAFRDWAMSNGYGDGLEIDRIDGTKGYSPENCRWVTRSQQMANRPSRKHPNRKSKFKGVTRSDRGRWRAVGSKNQVPLHLGSFDTEAEAARAYNAWAKENYGEFAYLNPV